METNQERARRIIDREAARNRNLVKRMEEPKRPSGHLTSFNTGLAPGTRSNAEIRRRNGGVKHMFEDDIGGCSANYQ